MVSPDRQRHNTLTSQTEAQMSISITAAAGRTRHSGRGTLPFPTIRLGATLHVRRATR